MYPNIDMCLCLYPYLYRRLYLYLYLYLLYLYLVYLLYTCLGLDRGIAVGLRPCRGVGLCFGLGLDLCHRLRRGLVLGPCLRYSLLLGLGRGRLPLRLYRKRCHSAGHACPLA
jgi:hypothetical protein